jgi:spectinomycin phosphotransferase
MRDEPVDLSRALLAREIGLHWGIEVSAIEYAPVGFGSYHWLAEDRAGRRWFVTGDRLSSLGIQDGSDPAGNVVGLEASYQTAAALREGGLSFVVAPIAGRSQKLALRVLPEWAVAVFPYIEGESSGPGEWTDSTKRLAAARLVGRVHGARPPGGIPPWDAAIPHRSALIDGLHDLERPWLTGPYADRVRRLLATSRPAIEALLRRYDRLDEEVTQSQDEWVVTHGEPHSANFISGSDGAMHLIDWDTVRLAPRERDLWIVAGDDPYALAAYQTEAGPCAPRPEAMELFRLRWPLADIGVYVRRFRGPHAGSEDDEASWAELTNCLTVDLPALGR